MTAERITDANEAFLYLCNVGKQLMDCHLNYEQASPFPLAYQWTPGIEPSYHVTKMRFANDRQSLIVNESLTLSRIPPLAHEYILGTRSALEWIIDQYQMTTDERSGIISDPNNADDQEYIVRLFCQVVTVSVTTVTLTNEMAARVNFDDFDLVGPLGDDEPLRDFWT